MYKFIHRLIVCCVLWTVQSRTATAEPASSAAQKPSIASNSEVAAYVDFLMADALHKGLPTGRQWLRLGHWRQSLWHDGWKTEIDGGPFFLASDGHKNPVSEMRATLEGFFQPAADPNKHPLCRFPARFLFLKSQLEIDMNRISIRKCPEFEEYFRLMDPKSVTLIFSSYYLSKAASAFGHTFFRVNKRNADLAAGTKRQLLDTGIDYSAQVTTSNSFAYAFLGMVGGFRGTFRKVPYYYKVREYNDYESRDLWEYELNLTPEQVQRFVSHLWELGPTFFDYFYLTENCSYHILGLLEAANPDLDLISKLKIPVIPADTVKAIYSTPGLVKDVEYRPSLHSQFQHRIKDMNSDLRNAVEELANDAKWKFPASMGAKEKIQAFDAAVDLLDLRHPDEILAAPSSKPGKAKRNLLARRATILLPSDDLEVPPPWNKMPQNSHGTRRFGAGVGSSQGRGAYASLQFRLTMHDLVDPPNGYPELSTMEFFRGQGRHSFQDQKFYLEELSILNIVQLIPIDRFNRGLSWKVHLGGVRLYDSGCDFCFVGQARVGGGYTYSGFGQALTLFATIDSMAAVGPSLDGLEDSPFRLGIGPYGGVRIRWSPTLLTMVTGEWLWLPEQEPTAVWDIHGTFRWQYQNDVALNLVLRDRQNTKEAQLSWLVYY